MDEHPAIWVAVRISHVKGSTAPFYTLQTLLQPTYPHPALLAGHTASSVRAGCDAFQHADAWNSCNLLKKQTRKENECVYVVRLSTGTLSLEWYGLWHVDLGGAMEGRPP